MRFFVAKVNLGEQARLGVSTTSGRCKSPTSRRNSCCRSASAWSTRRGQQELFVYALTRNGRVETTNYRTAKLPAGMDLPVYLKQPNEFASFYKAMFARQVDARDGRAVFLEYAWDMRWCDPCAADPLSNDELRRLGVFWAEGGDSRPPDVFLSRLHVRYDSAHFPEDLVFQETGDRANFQGRYVLRHAWTGGEACSGRNRVSSGAGRTARPRSRAVVAADRLEHRGHSSEDGSWTRRFARSRRRGGSGSGRSDRGRSRTRSRRRPCIQHDRRRQNQADVTASSSTSSSSRCRRHPTGSDRGAGGGGGPVSP